MCESRRHSGKGDHGNIKAQWADYSYPVSKDIKIGLLKAAVKKAGLTEEELNNLL